MGESGDSDSDINSGIKHQKINPIESDDESTSSSSDGESDKCPICLTRLGQDEIASPNSCLHSFCINCITEWAKNAKTCPIDRLEFKFIIVRSVDGGVIKEINVNLKNEQEPQSVNIDDLTYCEVCHLSNREDEMLLCDICDCGYHMDCLNPPLSRVPLEEWYCPQCELREEQSDNDIDQEEVTELLNDLNEDEQPPSRRIRVSRERLVPRTRASERVRMNTHRIQLRALNNEEGIQCSNAQRKVRRRIKKYSRRKNRTRKCRKVKKQSISKKRLRLADQLGMCSTKLNKSSFGDNSNGIGTFSNFVDHRSLSILGSSHELDYAPLESDNENDIGGDGPLFMSTIPRIRFSTADLMSRKEISEILRRPARKNINISHNIDSINILDTILNVQEKQFKKKSLENEMKNIDKHVTQTPMYSDHRSDRNTNNANNCSSNHNNSRNYSRNSSQTYPKEGNSSSLNESQLPVNQSFNENEPVNPFPFRNSGPIKFRMNVTKIGEKKQVQPPTKSTTTEYNVEEDGGSTSNSESFKALEPPPEPPALLMGINLDDDETDNLVIDDNEYYDPENPNEIDDQVEEINSAEPTYMQSPTYGGYMERVENNSIPFISNSSNNVLQQDEAMSSDDDDKETNDDCPNLALYSTTSQKLSSSPKNNDTSLEDDLEIEKLPPEEELEYIPMPPIGSVYENLDIKQQSTENEQLSTRNKLDVIEKPSINGDACVNNSDIDEVDKPIKTDELNDNSDIISNKVESIKENDKLSSPEDNNNSDLIEESTDISITLTNENEVIVDDLTVGEDLKNDPLTKQNNLNLDPISDSEEDKKKNKDQNTSNKNLNKDKLSNGKKEENKDSNVKIKGKESDVESVPWKKLSKSSKDRNYRYGKCKEKINEDSIKKEKKQKRKEIELYDIRKVLEERPRRKKDKFGRDLSKSSCSDSESRDRNKRKKHKRSRSRQHRRSISPLRQRNHKKSRSRHRSESKSRNRSKSKHRSKSRHRSRSLKHSSKHDRIQGVVKDRCRSPALYDDRELSPLSSKRSSKKSKEKNIYSKIEKDHDKKLVKLNKNVKKKTKKKLKDYQQLSPSRSISPGIHMWPSPRDGHWSQTDVSRTPSPVYGRRGTDIDIGFPGRDQDYSEYNDNMALGNLTVIVKNDNSKKTKQSKRHATRQVAVPPSKEVFASGDNILVSVNFKDSISDQTSQEPIKRKRQETTPVLSNKKVKNNVSNNTNLKALKKGTNRKKISRTIEMGNAKPVAIIDLNTSPFREIPMSPKNIIVLTDSDEDKQTKLETKKDSSPEKQKEHITVEPKVVEKNENSTQTIPTITIGGPKTPPEPTNLLSKPDTKGSCDFTKQNENCTQTLDVRSRGPNTPPEPPRSIDTTASETAYDPFEPTKSNSPSPPPRIDMFEDDPIDVPTQSVEDNKVIEKQPSISPKIIAKTITPPFLETPNNLQNEKKSPEKLVTSTANSLLYTSPTVNKAPSPIQLPTSNVQPDEVINLDNDDSQTTAFENEADSPYSPGEGFIDELRGSSPDSPPPPAPKILPVPQSLNKNDSSRSKLDTLLSILPRSKPTNVFDNLLMKNLKPSKFPLKSKHSKHNMSNDEIIDDLPGSAVELESKNKFLEKLNRQERVIDEVKLVLKPHYNKKHITKEQYKDIMRKAVPKICHNKSGEINPQKIQSLIEAYVIKYRHAHRKQVQRIPVK
ncbi:PHD and RING finger domain-containing protein 1 [Daktulosphaira vitifoliae]|uniref:PHD and RING finger domain-containing protein 1 n=1 Tax=Daktulosphaira vitifoliae TaxID=58002 RepID=UPI0021A9BBE3|nr:PHD and RING finger domain-containing protein 1 [Daktulosphaira vitifoliae]XP_050536674.1 PHD and RING finger domain-containing protein 1 [Daktulosphaira vitifoliae]XP_050536675.1 PHD and RING finger domain-containing protein 1 [Daktulosphaira vitifoliae]XP_050536676.1 PHD and RING finger domain-containing protein 1 [Daktulosphaira vitifoliae]XP_050536677.1 PHD and RING finger domain-containing protein 1 [Daktulosphaira vitifoliae]